MALTQTLLQMRSALRRYTNTEGTTALLRHPDADLNDYINRGLARLRFLLVQANPDQRYLASTTSTTTSGTSTVALPADFQFLISVDLTADGTKRWLSTFNTNERPALTSPDEPASGIPFCYRLEGANLELLPVPGGSYSYTLWYVPQQTELADNADTFDTVNRLDDFVIAYASRFVATKDKNWDLKGAASELLAELHGEIEVIGRTRDTNGTSRIFDGYIADRWGRSSFGSRRRA